MDWKVHVDTDASLWMRDAVALTIYRRRPDGSGEQLTHWDAAGHFVTEEVLPAGVPRPGFEIPAEALESLRDQLSPGPTQRELDQLREQLEVERARVDRQLEEANQLSYRLADGLVESLGQPAAAELTTLEPPDGSDQREAVRAAQTLAEDLRHRWAMGETGVTIADDLRHLAVSLGQIIDEGPVSAPPFEPPLSEALDRVALRQVAQSIREGHLTTRTEQWDAWMSELQRIAGPPGPDE